MNVFVSMYVRETLMLLYKCYFNAIIMHVHNHILNDVTFDKKLVVSICGLSCISLIDVCFVLYVQNYKTSNI